MSKRKQKVVVALSGGKDSTASVVLLKEQDYDVFAMTMKLGIKGEDQRFEKLKHLTQFLAVPLKIIDMRAPFQEKVIDYFLRSYAASLTPNPCVACNNDIKFNLLMQEALKTQQADFYATGHYAAKTRINGHYFLTEPKDRTKSQIYFLSMIGEEALKRVIFPISALTLEEVRKKVEDLPLVNKEESQDVCFLHDKKLIDYLKKHLPKRYFKPGDFLDVRGNKIGKHKGAVYFTIGQRRGTGFSSDRKLYVVKKDVQNNTVTLGEEEHLYADTLTVVKPVYWKEIKTGEVFNVKIRYMTPFSKVEITGLSKEYIKAKFAKPEKSVTPGQIGAFYQEDIIVAAGYIAL
jgi:tRNA-specific 2-thiouridylase